MSDKNPSLNALRVFAAAAYAGSFKQVAQQLGVSQSAITRQIQTLEAQLGTRLFQRDNRLHALTPAGQRLAPELQRIFESLNRLIAQTQDVGDATITTLKIAVSNEWLRWWLAPKLAAFYSIYPHIKLSFVDIPMQLESAEAAKAIEQLQHEGVDIVVASSRLRDRQISATPLTDLTLVPVAQERRELADYEWLVPNQASWWQDFQQQHASSDTLRAVHTNAMTMAVDLLLQPQTATLVYSQFLTHPQLQSLVALHDAALPTKQMLSLFVKKRTQQPVPIVAFSKWLQRQD